MASAPLLDLSDCVLACSEQVCVTRFLQTPLSKGRKQDTLPETSFTVDASVTPVDSKDLQRLPEGMRNDGTIRIISPSRLRTAKTSQCRVPDRVDYNGVRYNVELVNDWFNSGGFYEMFATREDR